MDELGSKGAGLFAQTGSKTSLTLSQTFSVSTARLVFSPVADCLTYPLPGHWEPWTKSQGPVIDLIVAMSEWRVGGRANTTPPKMG